MKRPRPKRKRRTRRKKRRLRHKMKCLQMGRLSGSLNNRRQKSPMRRLSNRKSRSQRRSKNSQKLVLSNCLNRLKRKRRQKKKRLRRLFLRMTRVEKLLALHLKFILEVGVEEIKPEATPDPPKVLKGKTPILSLGFLVNSLIL